MERERRKKKKKKTKKEFYCCSYYHNCRYWLLVEKTVNHMILLRILLFPFFSFFASFFFSIVDLRRVRIGTTNTHTIYCVVLSVPFYRYKFKGKERLFKRRTGRRRKNTRTTETMIRVRGLFVSFVDDQMSNIAVVIITKRNDTPYKLAKVSIWISIG